MERKNAWKDYKEKDLKDLEKLCKDYRGFLSLCKKERECTKEIVKLAKEKGYISAEDAIAAGKPLKTGDKIYAVCMDKSVVLFNIGKKPLEEGLNILGAHIDSPRIDIKQNPLYEESELAYFDTHYYGGIKKYQWVTIPLAIHGVIVKKNGEKEEICIGEKEDDPVFCITDLLVHLAGEQMEKKAAKVIEGEKLDLLIGSMPVNDNEKDTVKRNVMAILKDTYKIEEEDFMSAELEIVPAGGARELGIDRSMIMSYGQDDRVCAYTSLAAMLEMEDVDKTSCCLLVDKEEIGSVGATGMQSRFFENTLSELIELENGYSGLKLRRCLKNSRMLSSDVNAAYDPLFADAFEKKNSSYCGKGVVFSRFTEIFSVPRKIMDDNKVNYQMAELGKVDVGGGGTIAYILSLYGMEVIDCGVAVLNMHAPWEITSKADIYETKKCYMAFLTIEKEVCPYTRAG